MEFLDGETLAARVARAKGPLPLDQVLRIASEIADALDKAHRAGIVHRDLKPANIMLTKSGAKLLDFGLAKLRGPAVPISLSGMERATTAGGPGTATGTILGTMYYMAPEQVEGREADARSDIWALGVVIYEMATGARPFDGESAASVIGAILKDRPPVISTRQPLSPQSLDHIVERCLDKDADERWQNAGDLKRELAWVGKGAGETTTTHATSPSAGLTWAIGGILLGAVLAGAAGFMLRARAPLEQAPVMKFDITPPPHTVFASPGSTQHVTQLALSPDGKRLAFVAQGAGANAMLWLRSVDGTTAVALSATEDASYPFWAPDSNAIGFFAQAKLKRIDVPSGALQILCDVPDARGGSWGRGHVIVFGMNQSVLLQVPDSGGVPAPVSKLAPGDLGHRWPNFLPDGKHLLFLARRRNSVDSVMNVIALDGSDRKELFTSQFPAAYVGGYVLSLANGTLNAQKFDVTTETLDWEAVPIAQGVGGSTVNYGSFSASETGLLAFASDTTTEMQLTWFNRDGKSLATVGPLRDYADVQLMPGPNARRALMTRTDPQTGTANIWSIDVVTGDPSQITFDESVNAQPVVSPDGQDIVFRSSREIPAPIEHRLTSGAGGDDLVLRAASLGVKDPSNLFPTDWSPDGKFILFHTSSADTGYDIFVLPWTGDRKPRSIVHTRGADLHARFSPDGKWIAYSSAESGRPEIYVQPFPSGDGLWRLSADGGAEPRWRGDGRELFFIGADRRMMAVAITTGASFQHGPAVPLFATRVTDFANPYRTSYAVASDGQRFLINSIAENATPSSVTVIVNWPVLLRK